jgi:hypothetical protein
MAGMMPDAKSQVDDRRNAAASPELAPKTIGFGTALQTLGQTGELFGRQPARGPGWGPVTEGIHSALAGVFHPLADGPLADAQCLGDLTL